MCHAAASSLVLVGGVRQAGRGGLFQIRGAATNAVKACGSFSFVALAFAYYARAAVDTHLANLHKAHLHIF